MANENLKVDGNNKPVIGLVTDDSNQFIKMGRIDDSTKGLKVMFVGGAITLNTEQLGTTNGFSSTSNTLLDIGGTVNTYFQIYIQNVSTGTSASSDYIAGADNDGVALTGHYIDMGVNGSGWTKAANPTFNIENANDGYVAISGGNLFLETDQSNIVFAVGGYTTTNEVARLTTSSLTLGLVGTRSGSLVLSGSTSGTATITVPAVAGTPIFTLPTSSGTISAATSGVGAPLTIPSNIGLIFCDTSGGKVYIATGTSSSGDWKILN